MVDIDLMAYRLIQEAPTFDVIAAPNLFGDVLADLGAVLLGSRGLSFSGNFTDQGHSVFQTNHGAAYDLAGTDRANPVGQILSMAMMLREAFGLTSSLDSIEEAVRSVWHDGWRTEDVASPQTREVGTREMSRRVAERAGQIVRAGLQALQAESRGMKTVAVSGPGFAPKHPCSSGNGSQLAVHAAIDDARNLAKSWPRTPPETRQSWYPAFLGCSRARSTYSRS